MAKKGKPLFEEMVFNDVQYAKDIVTECEAKLAKCQKAMPIAVVGTICGVAGFIFEGKGIGDILVLVAFICAIVSYVRGGGLKVALSWGWKLCKLGWFIVPIFPFDLLAAVIGFVLAFVAFLCLPLIFVWLNKNQITKDYEAAKQYLSYCKPVES